MNWWEDEPVTGARQVLPSTAHHRVGLPPLAVKVRTSHSRPKLPLFPPVSILGGGPMPDLNKTEKPFFTLTSYVCKKCNQWHRRGSKIFEAHKDLNPMPPSKGNSALDRIPWK
jgi:hypothetical protein